MKAFANIQYHLLLSVSTTMLWLLLAIQAIMISASAETRSTYIVHMDKSHMPEPFTSHHHWHSSVLDSLVDQKSTHSPPSIIYSYDTVMHGFSARLTPGELKRLKNSLGFVSAYRDIPSELHTTRTPEFIGLSPTAGIWPASNFGDNIIIGVIDTGVWPESESFKDDGMSANIPKKWKGKCQEGQDFNSSMCNRKLIGAQYFNKGVAAENPGVKFTMNSARDESGHGTHTASTAAGSAVKGANYFGYAKGTATGIAPQARLAIYKVVWLEGSSAADYLAGIDKAVEDGVDVLSISLSFGRVRLYDDPVAIAAFGAMEKGVVVSLSAGNRGPRVGTGRNGSPWAVAVGAGTVDRTFGGTVTLGNGESIRGWSLFPVAAIVQNADLLYNRTLAVCNSTAMLLEAGTHFGQRIIVCDSTLPELQDRVLVTSSQIHHIIEAQVTGAIFISSEIDIIESGRFACPGVLISPKDKRALIRYAQRTEHPKASIKFQQTFVGTKPSPAVASFSSRGSTLGTPFIIKPDILAPGTRILAATVPTVRSATIRQNIEIPSDYDLKSGTSMACPHISGVAAMIKYVHPEWSPAVVKSAMMTTANPLDNTGQPITDNGDESQPASPIAMGSGHIDPNRALDPGLVYDIKPQEYVNFLCAMNYTDEQIKTITRSKAHDCSMASLDLNYPSFFVLCVNADTSGAVKLRRVVTNVGDGPATYRISVKTPKNTTVTVSPQKLVFEKKNDKQNYTVSVRCKKSDIYTFGELVWIEENGKHRVRSPIVVSPYPIDLDQ